MKKILCSILASSLCFTGNLPVFAGQSNLGGSNLGGTYGDPGSGNHNNMSRTKVFITFVGQDLILRLLQLIQLPNLQSSAANERTIVLIIFLITGKLPNLTSSLPDFKEKQAQAFDKSNPQIPAAQKEVTDKLISLGLGFEDGRPVRQLVAALTLMLPFGIDAKPTETISVAAVDGTKLYQAITAYNYIVDKVITTSQGQGAEAEKAKATLAKMESDLTFQAISTTLKAVREELEAKQRK